MNILKSQLTYFFHNFKLFIYFNIYFHLQYFRILLRKSEYKILVIMFISKTNLAL